MQQFRLFDNLIKCLVIFFEVSNRADKISDSEVARVYILLEDRRVI